MKEKSDSNSSEENSIKNKIIANDSINEFIYVLKSKKFFYVQITGSKQIYIKMKNYSFTKINEMLEASPEENVVFIFDKKVVYSPSHSFRLSKSSINRESNHSSFSSSISNKNMKNLNEEIINTDINELKIDTNTDNNFNEKINDETPYNNKNQDDYIFKNNRNMSTGRINNYNNNSNNIKCTLYKWIFHFYLIIGIIIFIHFLSFMLSKNNYSLYKLLSFLLFISLLYLGFFGIKYKNGKETNYIFNGNNLLWINYIILLLTIFCLVGLFYVENKDNYDRLMLLVYLATIIIEAIYILNYDVIKKVITMNIMDNNKHFDEYNSNSLGIQLVGVT